MKTKTTTIVDELREKYKERLAHARQELKKDEKRWGRHSYISDLIMFQKWAYRVGKGWYGFDLGHVPPVWVDMLNDFLDWVKSQCPDFEIQQIKMKMGMMRIYLQPHSGDKAFDHKIHSECWKLCNLMRTRENLRNVQAAGHARREKSSRSK